MLRFGRNLLLVPLALATLALLSGHAAQADDGGADSGGPVSTAYSLASGFSAKESCSCVFVVEQTDAYCKAFGQPSDSVAPKVEIDHAALSVTASFLGATRTAHFVDGSGCALDP
jgi:hypothetical protein